MISPSELRTVIDDIKQVAASAPPVCAHYSEDEDQSDNDFLPRDYDIDRLHADDARDKVFVAILKALVARHNKPSSPKELATCIMKHEFTLLGGATPYATVSSRISQHFKRILEHIPPRPPILGRVAHEKHTRKYFYYVASALEQEDFLRKVRIGLIPTHSTASSSNSSARNSKSIKKTRCMVPAVAVEPDLSLTMRRNRRANSADTTGQRPAGRSASHSEAERGRRSSRVSLGVSTRPRRTSYDGGSSRVDASGDEGSEESDGGNPYARKKYKSVRSAVAQVYPKRRSRVQSGIMPVVSSMAPRARRSASHGDTQSTGGHNNSSQAGAGKWRPSCSSSSDNDEADKELSDDEELSESLAKIKSYRLSSGSGSNEDNSTAMFQSVHHDQSDSEDRSKTAVSMRRRAEPATLMPLVPHTTPRASASPDRTPYPPATSPSFLAHRLLGESGSDGELQVASPLLLPRGLMSLQMPLDSIFGTSPIAGKDSIPSPADMMTPVVTAASVMLLPEDSVVPAAHSSALLLSAGMGLDTHDNKVTGTCPDFVKHNTTPEHINSPSETAAEPHTDDGLGSGSSSSSSTAPLISHSTKSVVQTDKGQEYDFSFHDLMDAELMSINELDKLWNNSNPCAEEEDDDDDSEDVGCRLGLLPTIPEVAMEDDGGGSSAAMLAAANKPTGANSDNEQNELPSKLTQKLLALSATPKRAAAAAAAVNSLAMAGCKSKKEQQQQTVAAAEKVSKRLDVYARGETWCASVPTSASAPQQSLSTTALDSVESTKVLVDNTDEHEETTTSCSKVVLPDPFADIPATAMVATKMAVSPRIVLTIVETVPVYMTVITTTEAAGSCTGKWIVRRHRLLRLVENGYVNASSLLLAGGVASEQERSIVLSLEVGRFKWRRPQSKLYGTWIPLPRARALAATCSLNHRLGPFLNDNLEAYFPAPLPTTFIRHLITPFFTDPTGVLLAASDPDAGLGIEFQHLVNTAAANHRPAQSISRSSTFGATARGTPSPSIIQSLATRPGAFSFAGAAKAIFGSDDRHLQSLLQLLSADSPMLSTPGEAERAEPMQAGPEPDAKAEAEAEAEADGCGQEDEDEEASDSIALDVKGEPKEGAALGEDFGRDGGKALAQPMGSDAVVEDTATVSIETDGTHTPMPDHLAAVAECTGVDAEKLAEAISSLNQMQDPMGDAMDCEMDLDMSMVMPGADSDADMICCSTPPSPPPPPALPLRQRRISNAPLTIPRSSPAISQKSLDGSVADGEDSQEELLDLEDDQKSQSRPYSPQQRHVGSFNARLAQTMEAFGFTGAAKTSLLLRLRAAAAAKSTGKQQAVAPYMLYRNNNSGGGSGGVKRGKIAAALTDDDDALTPGSVRKRAKVIRIPRVKPMAKPLVKQKKPKAAPDASVVMRLASAIYNHTLNMAALAQAQRQAAVSAEAASTAASTSTSATATVSVNPVPATSAARAQGAQASPGTRVAQPRQLQRPAQPQPQPQPQPQKQGQGQGQQGARMLQNMARVTSPGDPRGGQVRPGMSPQQQRPALPQHHPLQQQQQQQRPGGLPNRPPIRRPPMRPAGSMNGKSPVNLQQQQRPPMQVRRPPPMGSPSGSAPARPGLGGMRPSPNGAAQQMRPPLPRPSGTPPGAQVRRPVMHSNGVQRPPNGGPSPRPLMRPPPMANGMSPRPRPMPMPVSMSGGRPRPPMVRPLTLSQNSQASSPVLVRPPRPLTNGQQQQQASPVAQPATLVTPVTAQSAVRPQQKPPVPQQQIPVKMQSPQSPQLPRTPLSGIVPATTAPPPAAVAQPPPGLKKQPTT